MSESLLEMPKEDREDYSTLVDDSGIKLAPPDAVFHVKLKLTYKGEGAPLRVNWDDIENEEQVDET